MAEPGDSLLFATAKRHLGLSTSDNRVPHFYIEELKQHLLLYPSEDKFCVTLQPKVGFGSVTCLKEGCNQVIPLTKRVKVQDGGKVDGMGSLSAYRFHLSTHAMSTRRSRAKVEQSASPAHVFNLGDNQSMSPKTVKNDSFSLPSSVSAPPALAASKPIVNPVKETKRVRPIVKSESVEVIIPRKRLSDIAFPLAISEENKPLTSISSKKLKTESVPKTPLAPVTNTPIASSSTSQANMATFHPFPHPDIGGQLENVRLAIAGQKSLLSNLSRKRGLGKTEMQKVLDYEAELKRLRALEQQYLSSMNFVPGPSNPTLIKPEPKTRSVPFHDPSSFNTDPFAGSGRVQPFPISIKNEPSPSGRNPFNGGAPVPHPCSFTGIATQAEQKPFPNKDASDTMRPLFPRVSSINPILVASSVNQPQVEQNPFASNRATLTFPRVSPFGPTSILSGIAQPQEELKPLSKWDPPIPSGSGNAGLPAHKVGLFPDVDTDDEGSNPSDSEQEDNFVPDIAREVIDRLGLDMPPPILDDSHDSNGDYHGRGRDLFVGPQAENGDIEKFIVEAGNAEAFDGNETVDKALNYLGLQSLQDKPPGMDIALMAHQVMGVAWMLQQEKSPFNGGCLADEMGLGKTVQMIATIVMNQSMDPACKTTLILVPVALLDQWKEEIESKANCNLTCLIYHGQSRTRSKREVIKYDIVLTAFQTMACEWPDFEKEITRKAKAKKKGDSFIVSDSDDAKMKDPQYRKTERKKRGEYYSIPIGSGSYEVRLAGLLFQIDFYRVIADEGQNIRNRRTRVSRSITDLRCKYRWVLTGTPIVNTLADVYGYIRFLQIRFWSDWKEFHDHIGAKEKKNPGLAVVRMQKIMNTFLLRRKKDSKLDGKNLIELPDKKVNLVRLEFSPEERDIYDMVEKRSQAKFNRYLRAGTVLKNYHQVLVLLLRLRQICSHASLIQEGGEAFVHPDEAHVNSEFATELTRARRVMGAEFVERMKERFMDTARARIEAEKLSENATVEEEDCPICYDVMTDVVITACAHIFCRECIVDVLNRPQTEDANKNEDKNARPCPVCRSPFTEELLFSREAFEPTDEELNPEAAKDDDVEMIDVEEYAPRALKPRKKKKSGNPLRGFIVTSDEDADSEYDVDDDDISDFIVEDDEDEEEKDARRAMKNRKGKMRATIILDSDDEELAPEEKKLILGVPKKIPVSRADSESIKLLPRFLPSSKMKYMMDQLQELAKAKPDEKTLLVSQWTACLALISAYLTEKGIPHVLYQGDMNRRKREQAVQVFMSREKARVMLMSLKCGGVGLNLTRANNVISLDLGWSQAVESQAFDRVHRVGQTRNVLVQRVVIADTVEDRILKLQERKQTLADGSLGEGSGQKIGKLSVKELANLFGLDAYGRRLK